MVKMKDHLMINTTDINVPTSRLAIKKIIDSSKLVSEEKNELFFIKNLKSKLLKDEILIRLISIDPVTVEDIEKNFKSIYTAERKYGLNPTISNRDRIIFIIKGKTNVILNNENKRLVEGQYISIPAGARLNYIRFSTSQCLIAEVSKSTAIIKNDISDIKEIKNSFFSDRYISQFKIKYNKNFAKSNSLPTELYEKPYAIITDNNAKKIIDNIYPEIKKHFDQRVLNKEDSNILELPHNLHERLISPIAEYLSKKFNGNYNPNVTQCFRHYPDNAEEKMVINAQDAYNNMAFYNKEQDYISYNSKWPHIDSSRPGLFRAIIFLNDVGEYNGGTKYIKNYEDNFYSFDLDKINFFENDTEFTERFKKDALFVDYFPGLQERGPNDDEYISLGGPSGTIALFIPNAPHYVPPIIKGYRDAIVMAFYSK
jgi:hypothetical protein